MLRNFADATRFDPLDVYPGHVAIMWEEVFLVREAVSS